MIKFYVETVDVFPMNVQLLFLDYVWNLRYIHFISPTKMFEISI